MTSYRGTDMTKAKFRMLDWPQGDRIEDVTCKQRPEA